MGKCAYVMGCGNSTQKNQKYCCREHSPFGHLCKENYVPPRRGKSIYKPTPYSEEKPKPKYNSKHPSRKYSRQPQPADFLDDSEKEAQKNIHNDSPIDSE